MVTGKDPLAGVNDKLRRELAWISNPNITREQKRARLERLEAKHSGGPLPPLPLYLERDEIVVLLRALAKAVQSDDGILPNDPTALSKMVWDSERASPTARSLATALAEATY